MTDWAKLVKDTLGQFTTSVLPPNMKLPALPQAVTQFIQASSDPNVDLKVLGKIIETDSGLTMELLKHVNSAHFGLTKRVSSPQQALSLLGMSPARNLLIAVGTKAAIQSRQSKLINQSSFWVAALQKAIFAREIATMIGADPDVAFNGALLQDFLLPVVTNELYDKYLNFIQQRDKTALDIWNFEQTAFGWDHALAGACIAKSWKLPDELICCIMFHHVGLDILSHDELSNTAVAAVALSALLPDQMRQCFQGLEQLLALEAKWPAFNLRDMAEIVDAKQETSGLGVRNDFPLSRRCKGIFEQTPAAAMAR
ncbi:MAG: HDOD domain-containing protein [Planctomycetia bacterium]|nr:HDOD domain-containing protein [Planctomycetia bacterium]